MKKSYTKFLIIGILLISGIHSFSQTKVYSVTSGELLFQWADIGFTQEYMDAHPNDEQVGNPLRFTCFFHLGQYVHFDFTNSVGLFTGGAVRNVGFISDERLDLNNDVNDPNIQDFKIIRRSYNIGVPLAIKLGSFKDHTYLFAGGEVELAYAYKEKYWNSHNRSGSKNKTTQWFGSQTPNFMFSAFAGVQLPKGVNLKFKYYFDDFINTDYTNPNNAISDLTRYKSAQVMYVSLSWQFKTKNVSKKNRKDSDVKVTSI